MNLKLTIDGVKLTSLNSKIIILSHVGRPKGTSTNINLCEFDNVSAFLLYVSNNELLNVN